MMRDFLFRIIAHQVRKQKADLGIRSAIVFGSAFGSEPLRVPHIRVPGDSIHRGRSRPGWQNRLVEGRFVPDATAERVSTRRAVEPFLGLFCHKRPDLGRFVPQAAKIQLA